MTGPLHKGLIIKDTKLSKGLKKSLHEGLTMKDKESFRGLKKSGNKV